MYPYLIARSAKRPDVQVHVSNVTWVFSVTYVYTLYVQVKMNSCPAPPLVRSKWTVSQYHKFKYNMSWDIWCCPKKYRHGIFYSMRKGTVHWDCVCHRRIKTTSTNIFNVFSFRIKTTSELRPFWPRTWVVLIAGFHCSPEAKMF